MLEEPKPVEFSPERLAAVRAQLHNVLSSEAFKGSKRAQDFLQLVVEHALAGRLDALRERMLGAEMFGRPVDYDTANDAVVRVKASEVRRRLARYYDGPDTNPPVRISLTSGSYVPQFLWAVEEIPSTPAVPPERADAKSASTSASSQSAEPLSAVQEVAPPWKWKSWLRGSLFAAYSAVLISLTWFAVAQFDKPRPTPMTSDPIWAALFEGKRNTFIVPADAGFNLLEDLAQHPIPLAEYVNGGYLGLPLAGID